MRVVGFPETQFRPSLIPCWEEVVQDLMSDFVDGCESSSYVRTCVAPRDVSSDLRASVSASVDLREQSGG